MSSDLKKIISNFLLCNKLKGKQKSASITYSLPPGASLENLSKFLQSEINQTASIKNKNRKKESIIALHKIINKLKEHKVIKRYNKTSIGLLFFANEEYDQCIEPLSIIRSKNYYCDTKFNLEKLEGTKKNGNFGLIVLDRGQASHATYDGEKLSPIVTIESQVPNQTKKGGQSARRYDQIRENETLNFYKKISDSFVNKIGEEALGNLNEIFIGGLFPCAEEFCKRQAGINPILTSKILSNNENIMDTNEMGIYALLRLKEQNIEEISGKIASVQLESLKKFDSKNQIMTSKVELIDNKHLNYKLYLSTKAITIFSENELNLLLNSAYELGFFFDSESIIGKNFDEYFTNGFAIYEI